MTALGWQYGIVFCVSIVLQLVIKKKVRFGFQNRFLVHRLGRHRVVTIQPDIVNGVHVTSVVASAVGACVDSDSAQAI